MILKSTSDPNNFEAPNKKIESLKTGQTQVSTLLCYGARFGS